MWLSIVIALLFAAVSAYAARDDDTFEAAFTGCLAGVHGMMALANRLRAQAARRNWTKGRA
jgi:hypothetical protein